VGRPRQVSDEAILAAARRCFLEHGPGVSTTVIADELEVSQAALFKRFGTKQQLMLAALLPPSTPSWVATVEAGLEVATAIVRFFVEYAPCLMTIRASGCDLKATMRERYDLPPPLRARKALTAWLQQAMAEGRIRSVDCAATAEAMMGALQGHAFLSFVSERPAEPERFVANLVGLLWRGLAPEAS
jgi:AcrR family transcriptional regulator